MKGHRQLLLGLIIGIAMAILIMPSVAGAIGTSVGTMDLEKAVTSHPSYDSKMATFEDFKKQQDARLDVYRNKQTLSDDDKAAIVNLRLEIDNTVSDKYAELFNPLEKDVIDAVSKVGKESGIEVIIDSKAVLYGGLDLTPAVIKELKK